MLLILASLDGRLRGKLCITFVELDVLINSVENRMNVLTRNKSREIGFLSILEKKKKNKQIARYFARYQNSNKTPNNKFF